MCGPIKSFFKKSKPSGLPLKQGGFTLVEIAVVMVIVGIAMASFLHVYGNYVTKKRIDTTESNRKLATLALDDFKRRFGRYPCPARYDADRDDADYGIEGDCQDVSIAPGLCQGGICIEESERVITNPDGTTFTPRVRRGSLPFRDMYMAEDTTFDSYGGRFSYAVTERLASTATFDVRHGGISIIDDNDNTLVEPVGSALYFMYSHGPDNVGAYNFSGQQILPCSGLMQDVENCNTSTANAKAIYRHKIASTVPVNLESNSASEEGQGGGEAGNGGVSVNKNRHYDDMAAYVGNEEKSLWKYSEEPTHEDDVHDLLSDGEVLEVGTPGAVPPAETANLKVNVEGAAKAEEKIRADNLCSESNTDCTQAYRIGGTGMTDCVNTGDAGIGVAQNKIVCGAKPTLVAGCADGEFLTGLDADGQPICGTISRPKPCAATTKRVCSINKPLAESPRGTSITLTGGASFTQTWTCQQQGNGSSQNSRWVNTGETGVCNCTASTAVNGGIPCGTGFGNTVFTRTTTTVCPSGQVTVTDTAAATCVCTPFVENGTTNCPGNFTGQIPRTRPWTCNGNAPRAGTWTNTPGNFCTCNLPATDVQVTACAGNLDGEITTTRPLNATTCTYGAATVTNTCTCNPRAPQTRDQSCPSPTTGVYQQQRTFQCPAGTWSGWTDLPNSRQTNCSCVNRTETRFVQSCTAPQTGGHNEERTVDCHGAPVSGSAGQWTMVGTQSCQSPPPPPVCKLSSIASPSGPFVAAPPAAQREGAVCTCGSGNVSCFVPISGADWQRSPTCSCGGS